MIVHTNTNANAAATDNVPILLTIVAIVIITITIFLAAREEMDRLDDLLQSDGELLQVLSNVYDYSSSSVFIHLCIYCLLCVSCILMVLVYVCCFPWYFFVIYFSYSFIVIC